MAPESDKENAENIFASSSQAPVLEPFNNAEMAVTPAASSAATDTKATLTPNHLSSSRADVFTEGKSPIPFSPFTTANFCESSLNQINDCSKRTLIIVPGYSCSSPPRIGDHRYYINALKYHTENNPYGYKRIYVFDLYSEKDGRCNFKADLSELAEELWVSINIRRDHWQFEFNGEIDFIGASMGGLIIRRLIKDHLVGENSLKTKIWGELKIKNVVLIATPNFGCKIVDLLQAPLIQFLLELLFGKDNFSRSEQVRQVGIGNQRIYGRFLGKLFKKKNSENTFLKELNSGDLTPGNIRWITLRGTKRKWFTPLIYGNKVKSDGVVEAAHVPLKGAENICDKDLGPAIAWNHRDLYEAESVCRLLYGLLVMNLRLADYLNAFKPNKSPFIGREGLIRGISKQSHLFQPPPSNYPKG